MNIIAEKILRQKNKKVKRRISAVSLKTAKTALIVYDATDSKQEKDIRTFAHFLKEEGIKVTTTGFYQKQNKEDLKPEDELNYHYFDKTSFNVLGFPKNTLLDKIIANEYHLLFDFNLAHRFQLQVIATLSRANMKVGKSGGYQNHICDLTLAVEKNELNYLINQMKVYLNMIKK